MSPLSTAPPPSPPRLARAAPLVAALLAGVVYLGALGHGFAYDDWPIIVENELVRSGGRLLDLLGASYWQGDGILYRPLPMLTYWLDWRIGDGAPWVFHLHNLLWHALATALVVRLSLRWLPAVHALVVGALFAIHPMHVEAVANVVGRADLMAAVGMLCIAAGSGKREAGHDARRWRAAVLAVSFLAMCAKEVAIVAPLIAWAATRLDEDVREAWRLTAASAAGVALALVLRVSVLGSVAQHPPHPAFGAVSSVEATLLALSTLPRAVLRMLVPITPAPDHSPPLTEVLAPSWLLVMAGAAIVASAFWAFWRHTRRPTAATFAILIAALTFAPVSNLVLRTGVVLGERTLYAPSAGAMLLLGVVLHALWQRRRAPALAAVGAWAGAAIVLTLGAVPIWRSTERVLDAMVARSPRSYWGHYHYGRQLLTRGDLDGAAAAFASARALFDRDANLALDAATLALRRERREDARRLAMQAVSLAPENERARALASALERR